LWPNGRLRRLLWFAKPSRGILGKLCSGYGKSSPMENMDNYYRIVTQQSINYLLASQNKQQYFVTYANQIRTLILSVPKAYQQAAMDLITKNGIVFDLNVK
jgi:hypothetical protein